MEGRKGQAALEHFKSAAEQNTNSGQVLEILGELLARSDPQGRLLCTKFYIFVRVIKKHHLHIALQSQDPSNFR